MKKLNFLIIAAVVLALAAVFNLFGRVSTVAAEKPETMVKVLIGFENAPGASEQALVRAFGGEISHTYMLVSAIAAEVPEKAMRGLENHPLVTVVEPDGKVYAIGHESELDNTWGVARIGAGEVHHEGNVGSGVKVAVIDSGIDYNHTELSGAHVGGYNFVSNTNDPFDDNGHGTHVAGTVAAAMNGVGVVGTSPGVNLYSLKVLDSSGGGYWSDVIAAVEWTVTEGIELTNNSYGAGSDPGTLVRSAFDNSAAAGVLHIAAAGNSGNCGGRGNSVGYPARYDSVVAVAATNQNDNRPCFSSTGPSVELAAPGVSINSTVPGGGYASWSGTSMASPHVAGTAALVMAAGVSDIAQVRQVLRDTADNLGNSNHYGYGLVNAVSAVAMAAPTPPPATGTISGTVTDADSTLAIAGAVVTDGVRSTTTDNDGNYTLTDVPEGDYTVTASATGFETVSQSATVIADETTTVNFALQEATSATGVKVDSIAYATNGGRNNDRHLSVTVSLKDNLGEVVAGASVSITLYRDGNQVASGTGTTGSNGTVSFTLNNAASGFYETVVDDVSADGLVWDGVYPVNGFEK